MSLLAAVWSERNEPGRTDGKLVDCTQSSYLEGLLYGGVRIPNAFTVAERERFENAEGLPEYNPADGAQVGREQETGLFGYGRCDIASQKLYGVVLRQIRAASTAVFDTLSTKGAGVLLTGMGVGLPSHTLGSHSVFFVGRGDGTVLVYDPMAPMGSGPTGATVAGIWAWHLRNGYDARVVADDEFVIHAPADPNPPADPLPLEFAMPVSTSKQGSLFIKPGLRYAVTADGSRGLPANYAQPSRASYDAYAVINGELCLRVSGASAYRGQFFRETDLSTYEAR